MSTEKQNFDKGQILHFGLRARQTFLPCHIKIWLTSLKYSWGIILIKSCSIFVGSVLLVRPNLVEILFTWVSTAIPTWNIESF